jgi:hypothetical protein
MKTTLVCDLKLEDVELAIALQEQGEDVVYVVNGAWGIPNAHIEAAVERGDGLIILELHGYSEAKMPDRFITVPIWSSSCSTTWADEHKWVCSIGSNERTLITRSMQERYRELQGLRDWLSTFDLCVSEIRGWDDEVLICGHSQGVHDPQGCRDIDWDDYGRVYCQCESYTRPAPLVRI